MFKFQIYSLNFNGTNELLLYPDETIWKKKSCLLNALAVSWSIRMIMMIKHKIIDDRIIFEFDNSILLKS